MSPESREWHLKGSVNFFDSGKPVVICWRGREPRGELSVFSGPSCAAYIRVRLERISLGGGKGRVSGGFVPPIVNPARNGFSKLAKFAGKAAESPVVAGLVIENESCRWNPGAVAIRLEP